jgi:hypothetical protein
MMNKPSAEKASAVLFVIYWSVVAIPLAWGVWKTMLQLPALFQ